MDPYEILGVSRDATVDEIRNAYRSLVKKYHPDVNSSPEAAEKTSVINAAYDLLTDRASCSSLDVATYSQTSYEEDPLEAYKREYKAHKIRESRRRAEEKHRRQAPIYQFMRILCYPLAILCTLFIVDYFLPTNTVTEVPEKGYQKVVHGKYGSYVISYMITDHFEFRVPDIMHVNYDYYTDRRQPVVLIFTPIFKSIVKVGVVFDDYSLVYSAPSSPYRLLFFPAPYIVLGLCLIFIWKKAYSETRYRFSYMPFAIVLVVYFILAISG